MNAIKAVLGAIVGIYVFVGGGLFFGGIALLILGTDCSTMTVPKPGDWSHDTGLMLTQAGVSVLEAGLWWGVPLLLIIMLPTIILLIIYHSFKSL